MTALLRSKWTQPLFCVFLGACCFVALWAGGRPGDGVIAFVLLCAFGLAVLLGGRSDLVRGLRGDGRDEYWQRIDVHATALAGHVTVGAIIVMCFWEWAHGHDGTPYTQLGALAGIAYLVSVGLLRWRS
jgi:hypothetical protein